MVLCKNFIFNNPKLRRSSFYLHRNSSTLVAQLGDTRRRFAAGFIPNAGKRKRERSWWQRFFFDEDGNWLGLKEDDMLVEAEDDLEMDGSDEGEKFEAWKTRAEAIVELREAQQDMTNEENRKWEDWLADSNSTSWEAVQSDPTQEKGLLYSLTDFVLRKEDDDDDDMLYEDRVFRYASLNSVSAHVCQQNSSFSLLHFTTVGFYFYFYFLSFPLLEYTKFFNVSKHLFQ